MISFHRGWNIIKTTFPHMRVLGLLTDAMLTFQFCLFQLNPKAWLANERPPYETATNHMLGYLTHGIWQLQSFNPRISFYLGVTISIISVTSLLYTTTAYRVQIN